MIGHKFRLFWELIKGGKHIIVFKGLNLVLETILCTAEGW